MHLPLPIVAGRPSGCTGYDNGFPEGAQVQLRNGAGGQIIISIKKPIQTVTSNISLKDLGSNGLMIFTFTYITA